MTNLREPNQNYMDIAERASRLLSILVAVVGTIVLFAWILNIVTLHSILPGLPTMKFNTALLFMLSGISRVTPMPRIRRLVAGVVIIIAGLTLVEYAVGLDFGIDEWLIHDLATTAADGAYPGRMSIMTAVSFVLVGIGVLLIENKGALSQLPILLVGFLAMIALGGYLFNSESLYSVTPFSTMALHTALGFLLLSLSIPLADVDNPLTGIVLYESAGGFLVRRFLPIAILALIAFDLLQFHGFKQGFYNAEFGMVLITTSNIVVLIAITRWVASFLHQVDVQRMEAKIALHEMNDELEIRLQERTQELMKANQALQVSESLFSGMLDTAHDGIISIDEQQRIILFNQGASCIFGYQTEEVINQPLNLLLPARSHNQHQKYVDEFGHAGSNARRMAPQRSEVRGLRKNGEEFLAEVSISSLTTTEGQVATAIIRDVTQRQQMEQRLQETTTRFRAIVQNLPGALIHIFDRDMRYVYNDGQGMAALGLNNEMLIGKSIHDVLKPDVAQMVAEHYRRVLNGETVQFEGDFDGQSFLVISTPLWDDGTVNQILALSVNITKRKKAEEQILQINKKFKQQTLELEAINKELETFSYSVSHDLRAPLRAIDGFSQVLLEDYMDQIDEDGQDYLQRVRSAANRMSQLIDDMLSLSRITRAEVQLTTLDLGELAQTTAAQLQEEQPLRSVEWDIEDDLQVYGDSHLLKIVLNNLLGNAWKFTSKQEHARIEVGTTERDNGQVVCFVRDNGAGFDMTYADKLFGAFQRLHAMTEFEGTGIGLATVKRIIHRHGGEIWAEAEVGKGATFFFTLPYDSRN